ncbi:MAG: hypothetical protein P8P36_07220 [Akkermansiaceae bacterium]|nr:hypothetical protein [Akkermansiaceae bacterium]
MPIGYILSALSASAVLLVSPKNLLPAITLDFNPIVQSGKKSPPTRLSGRAG